MNIVSPRDDASDDEGEDDDVFSNIVAAMDVSTDAPFVGDVHSPDKCRSGRDDNELSLDDDLLMVSSLDDACSSPSEADSPSSKEEENHVAPRDDDNSSSKPTWTTNQKITATAAAVALTAVSHECRRQTQLTAPPSVYGQGIAPQPIFSNDATTVVSSNTQQQPHDTPAADIYHSMLKQHQNDNDTPLSSSSVLIRPIRPSFLVGTRSTLASALSYVKSGPVNPNRVRQILTMPQDGAAIALDYELPMGVSRSDIVRGIGVEGTTTTPLSSQSSSFLPLTRPVVLILHGINNHAGFGYMRSLMRAVTDQGWIAVGMNFRGCWTESSSTNKDRSSSTMTAMQTPRPYTGAYTGDIRGVVQHLQARLCSGDSDDKNSGTTTLPLILVGHSLGANLVTKYLGEQGDQLPSCVAGGVALGNPFSIDSRKANAIVSPLIALGAKRGVWNLLPSLRPMMRGSSHFRDAIHASFRAHSLADYDVALSPIFPRNDPTPPFAYRVGYQTAQDYWTDASSYRYARTIAVPFLQIVASDDFLVVHAFTEKLYYNLQNPNILVLQTKVGGHLGWWHEASTDRNGTKGSKVACWADTAVTEFATAVLERYFSQQEENVEVGNAVRSKL